MPEAWHVWLYHFYRRLQIIETFSTVFNDFLLGNWYKNPWKTVGTVPILFCNRQYEYARRSWVRQRLGIHPFMFISYPLSGHVHALCTTNVGAAPIGHIRDILVGLCHVTRNGVRGLDMVLNKLAWAWGCSQVFRYRESRMSRGSPRGLIIWTFTVTVTVSMFAGLGYAKDRVFLLSRFFAWLQLGARATDWLAANLKIIDARYHDFHGFPAVNWH